MTALRQEPANLTITKLYAYAALMERNGWQWKKWDAQKGWWTHPTALPHRSGDPKEYWLAVKNTYLLYTDLPLEPWKV